MAILRSVLYASLFSYPLTLPELRRTLLERIQDEAGLLRVYGSSPRLRQLIELRDGFFFPRGRGSWIDERRRRRDRSLALLQRNRGLLKVVCALPFVRMVALSGSVAALNAERDADLDIFAVTSGHHAWSVTLAIVVLAKLARRRRVLCANFVMADTSLTLERQDLFSASQIIQLRPLMGDDALRDFVAANGCVTRFYPNSPDVEAPAYRLPIAAGTRRLKRWLEGVLEIPSRPIEALCRTVYGGYLRRQAAAWQSPGEVRLSMDCLKLHSRSHRATILRRFDQLCQETLNGLRSAEEMIPSARIVDRQAVNT
jgi:hypothetical protein